MTGSNKLVRELCIAGLVALTALVMAVSSMNAARGNGTKPFYYQSYFEPAVRMACGQPFEVERASGGLSGELVAFLKQERETLSCEAVSPARQPSSTPATRVWYHMLSATALVWKLTGISWPAVDGIAAVLLAVASVCVYAMFRLWMAALIAAVLALYALVPALDFLLNLRDLSKTPFILAAACAGALLVSVRLAPIQFFTLMGAVGLWLGVGYGFRPDALIGLPLVAVAALLFRAGSTMGSWRTGVAGIAIMFAAFLIAVSPVIPGLGGKVGTCHWHFALLGLSDTHTALLGLQPGDVSWLSHYLDEMVWRSVESYADRTLGIQNVGYCTPLYDEISRRVYLETLATFPADFLQRALAAARQIVGYGAWAAFSKTHNAVIAQGWIWVWAGLLVVALAANPSLGLFACFALGYLCAYPVVQFDTRHYFHLAFLGLLPIGVVAGLLYRCSAALVRAAWRGPGLLDAGRPKLPSPRSWLRAVLILVVLVAALWAIGLAAAMYQRSAAKELFSRYAQASGETARLLRSEDVADNVHLSYQGFEPEAGRRVVGRMLRMELGGDGCPAGARALTLAVTGPVRAQEYRKAYAFSAEPSRSNTTIVVPVYFQAGTLTGIRIEIPRSDLACLLAVTWLDTGVLPPLWVSAKL